MGMAPTRDALLQNSSAPMALPSNTREGSCFTRCCMRVGSAATEERASLPQNARDFCGAGSAELRPMVGGQGPGFQLGRCRATPHLGHLPHVERVDDCPPVQPHTTPEGSPRGEARERQTIERVRKIADDCAQRGHTRKESPKVAAHAERLEIRLNTLCGKNEPQTPMIVQTRAPS